MKTITTTWQDRSGRTHSKSVTVANSKASKAYKEAVAGLKDLNAMSANVGIQWATPPKNPKAR